MDKIELLQAIELHKRAVSTLAEERSMFYEFLENAKRLNSRDSFKTWVQRKKKKVALVAQTRYQYFCGN